jgi:RNA-directed DNA polymerase
LKTSKFLTRDDGFQRIDGYPALGENLLKKVLAKENMSRAWKQVRNNKGSPGIDGITVEEFPEYYRPKWEEISNSLRTGTYQPKPVKRVVIEKEGGGERLLGIPCVLDRLIQQAIYQVLLPLYDPYFSENSYGFRPGKSQHMAIKQVKEYVKKGYKIAIDVDLSKFFDTINHDYLMSILGQRIKDKASLKLIGKYLRAGIYDKGKLIESREGVPQGSPLSPLLSNIVLDKLDKELEKRGHKFARYADDFVILVKSKRAGERVMASITRFVEKKLKLKVNGQKSKVVPVEESKFLGFTFKGKRIAVHPKAMEKFSRRVRTITGRSWGVSMEVKIKELTQYLSGWMNYFGIAVTYQTSINLDQWIRRRVRMCYWKQWHRPRTKVRNLIELGVSQNLAVTCGASSKGYWKSAKNEGVQMALNNKLLMEQRLVSLRDIWISLRYG